MCTRRVHPTRRVVFTSRGAKRRVRCEKKNSRTCTRRVQVHAYAHVHGAESAHTQGENSRTCTRRVQVHAYAHVHGAESAHTQGENSRTHSEK